jgi:hypothetical protein
VPAIPGVVALARATLAYAVGPMCWTPERAGLGVRLSEFRVGRRWKRDCHADAAVFALLVDAKDEAAARFYRHHGFEAFAGRAKRPFLPVATARRVVEG